MLCDYMHMIASNTETGSGCDAKREHEVFVTLFSERKRFLIYSLVSVLRVFITIVAKGSSTTAVNDLETVAGMP